MKALQFTTYGPPSVLTVADRPALEPRAGEVLVKVAAAGINPGDVKNVAGHFDAKLPGIPGRDYAGVVVGGDAEKGMAVWGSGARRYGAHAEYVIVPAEWISRKPPGLPMQQAAAIGLPYITAWSAVVTAGEIEEGETILIIGVSGAVGSAATQIAHWKKARVIGASKGSENPARADELIVTSTHDLAAEVRRLTSGKGADLVLDAVGGPMFEPALRSLRQGGRQMVISSSEQRVTFDLVEFFENQSRLIGVDTGKLTGQDIAALMDVMSTGFNEGHLHPPAITTWKLEDGAQAYEAVKQGRPRSKHVLIPAS